MHIWLRLTFDLDAPSGSIPTAHNTRACTSRIRIRPPVLAHVPRQIVASAIAVTMNDEIPPLPPHWIFDGERESPNYTGSLTQKTVLDIHHILCLVIFGRGSLRPIWERVHTVDTKGWEEGRNLIKERIQHSNIVVRTFDFSTSGSPLVFVGRFASYHDCVLLQHRSAEGFYIPSIHERGTYLSHTSSLRTFLCGSYRRVHNCVNYRECKLYLVL